MRGGWGGQAPNQPPTPPQLEADASNRIPLDVSTAPDTSNWHQLDVIPAERGSLIGPTEVGHLGLGPFIYRLDGWQPGDV